MALLDKILGRNKTITDLNATELRREEILLGKQRDRLFKKIEDVATAKQKMLGLAMYVCEPPLPVEREERIGNAFENGGNAIPGAAEFLLGGFTFRDVLNDAKHADDGAVIGI